MKVKNALLLAAFASSVIACGSERPKRPVINKKTETVPAITADAGKIDDAAKPEAEKLAELAKPEVVATLEVVAAPKVEITPAIESPINPAPLVKEAEVTPEAAKPAETSTPIEGSCKANEDGQGSLADVKQIDAEGAEQLVVQAFEDTECKLPVESTQALSNQSH